MRDWYEVMCDNGKNNTMISVMFGIIVGAVMNFLGSIATRLYADDMRLWIAHLFCRVLSEQVRSSK